MRVRGQLIGNALCVWVVLVFLVTSDGGVRWSGKPDQPADSPSQNTIHQSAATAFLSYKTSQFQLSFRSANGAVSGSSASCPGDISSDEASDEAVEEVPKPTKKAEKTGN